MEISCRYGDSIGRPVTPGVLYPHKVDNFPIPLLNHLRVFQPYLTTRGK